LSEKTMRAIERIYDARVRVFVHDRW
jgi:hypothetical protein